MNYRKITPAEIDRGINLYISFDEEKKEYGVYGLESGFCYASVKDHSEAEKIRNNCSKEY